MDIQANRVVGIHYTLKNDAGHIIASKEREPLFLLYGHGNIVRGLEQALIGKTVEDKIDVTVEPEDGYGIRQDNLLQEVPRFVIKGVDDLYVGKQFEAKSKDGPITLRVVDIDGNMVTVDGNHAFAGMRLHYSVSVVSIRDATPDEISQGHVLETKSKTDKKYYFK